MFHLVITCYGKLSDFTALDPTCVAAPPIQLVLSERYQSLANKRI